MEVEGAAHDNSKANLADHLKDAAQSFLVFFEDLDVIVKESDGAHPKRGDEHEDDINVVQFCPEHRWKHDGQEDDDPAHGWCAGFLVLPFESKVTHGFAYLQTA